MAWTKAQLIGEAYAELALAGYSVDLSPEEIQSALRRMDAMVAAWEARGISIGYALPATPEDSSVNVDSGIADRDAECVFMNLAVRLAAGKGKTLSQGTLLLASIALQTLSNEAAAPRKQSLAGDMPSGQGNRQWWMRRRAYLPVATDDPLVITTGGDLNISQE